MFQVISYTILKKRLCRETSLIDKGEHVVLTKEDGRYKTMMLQANGFKYWPKVFCSLEKATADFNSRVESRMLSEGIFYNKVFKN